MNSSIRCKWKLYRIFKCGNERLVSHSWWRKKIMKAGDVGWLKMWLNYFKDSEETVSAMMQAYAGFSQRGRLLSIYRANHMVRNPAIHSANFFQNQLCRNRRRKSAVLPTSEKIATRQLISRIILASVINDSSRRRRGLVPNAKVSTRQQCMYKGPYGNQQKEHNVEK